MKLENEPTQCPKCEAGFIVWDEDEVNLQCDNCGEIYTNQQEEIIHLQRMRNKLNRQIPTLKKATLTN